MRTQAAENMCYLAEHIHFFEFHTLHARSFKHELQQWWASEHQSPAEAARLQSEYLQLCEADPLAAGCGWFHRKTGPLSRKQVSHLMWLEERGIPLQDLPVCEISAKCREAYFLREENSFLGMLSSSEQEEQLEPLLSGWYFKLRQTLELIRSQSDRYKRTLQEDKYHLIYDPHDNFNEFNTLILASFTITALQLLPRWLRLLRTTVTSLFSSSFDWGLTNDVVMQMPESAGLPLLVLAVLLVMEVFGLAAIPQAAWETYFLLYRRSAMVILWLQYRCAGWQIRYMENRAADLSAKLAEKRYRWPTGQKSGISRLCFRMPQWVRIGSNPFFAPGSGLESVKQTFRIYPYSARPGKQTRTISPNSAWLCAFFCACLISVFVLDLPAWLRLVLRGLGI